MQRICRKRQNRIGWEALADEAVRHNFSENVDQRFSRLAPTKVYIETEWWLFRTAILAAATETCGVKRIGPPIGQKRTPWWNDEVRAVVAEKKAAHKAWVGRQTAETRQKYLQARDRTKEVVSKAKAAFWEHYRHRLESNYLSADKIFWQTIGCLRKRACPIIFSIKNTSSDLLSGEKDILNRLKEYFPELYNPTLGRQGAPSERERDETSDIAKEKVQIAIRALKPGKAAGIDEIRPEMLKSLSYHGIHWLTRVCRIAWMERRAPVDWQTGIVVPIFKKGTGECSNYRGITLLTLPGKVYAGVWSGDAER